MTSQFEYRSNIKKCDKRLVFILLASGGSTRFEHKIPKVYHRVKYDDDFCPTESGFVIDHSLYRIAPYLDVMNIVIVVSHDHHQFYEQTAVYRLFCEKNDNNDKIKDKIDNKIDRDSIHFVYGGNSRAQSVINALEFIRNKWGANDGVSHVMIHDAARPRISHRVLDEHISIINRGVAAIDTCIPIVDAIKRYDFSTQIHKNSHEKVVNGDVISRTNMYLSQTPMSFDFAMLYGLYNKKNPSEFIANITDEVSFCMLNDVMPNVVIADYNNIKITYEHDLRMVYPSTFDQRGCESSNSIN